MPEQWGRPTWQIDTDPEPSPPPLLFWIVVGIVSATVSFYFAWRLFR